MEFENLFGPNPFVPDLKAENRWEAIDELMNYLVATHQIKSEHKEEIARLVIERESQMSIGIGFGIGIPHAKTELFDDFVGVIGRSPKGIEFDALDRKPVDLVILVLAPKGSFEKHLEMNRRVKANTLSKGVQIPDLDHCAYRRHSLILWDADIAAGSV